MTPDQIQQLKTLRAITGISLDKCRLALENTHYDLEAARAYITQHLLPHADAKAHRTVSAGLVVIRQSQDHCTSLVVVKAETDFVAMQPSLKEFAHLAAEVACQNKIVHLEALVTMPIINTALRQLILTLGENIQLTTLITKQAALSGFYVHADKIGCIVTLAQGDPQIAHELAVHIVGFHPSVLNVADFPADFLAEQMDLIRTEHQTKPAAILEKIIAGKKKLLFAEEVLMCQPFFRQNELTVGEYVQKHQAIVQDFVRIAVN